MPRHTGLCCLGLKRIFRKQKSGISVFWDLVLAVGKGAMTLQRNYVAFIFKGLRSVSRDNQGHPRNKVSLIMALRKPQNSQHVRAQLNEITSQLLTAVTYRPAWFGPAAGWLLAASRLDEDVLQVGFLFLRAAHSLASTLCLCTHFQLEITVFICSSNMADSLTVME
jgi:hypothetical protein